MIGVFSEFIALFPHALVCGAITAVACSILGVFVIMKRVVFISIALSETAAFGIALSMTVPLGALGIRVCSCPYCTTHLSPLFGATMLTLAAVLLLSLDFESRRIPRDAVLGLVFLMASSLSILLVAKSGFGLDEIKNLLYGDLILARPRDSRTLLFVCAPVLAGLFAFLRPMLYTFLDRDAARVMNIRCRFWEMAFFLALGLVVSAASQTAGALLVFCYLVLLPAAALLICGSLGAVLALAPVLAVASTVAGLMLAYTRDLPANPTIIVCGGAVFVLSGLGALTARAAGKRLSHRR